MKIKILCCAIFATAFAGNFAPRVLAAPAGSFGPDERLMARVVSRYAAIGSNLTKYRVVRRELYESNEGGELVAYFEGKSPRRMIARFYGETGRAREEYSFWNGRLFAAYRIEERYAEPLGYDQPKLPIVTLSRRTQERFYYDNGRAFYRAFNVKEKEPSPFFTIIDASTAKERADAAQMQVQARRLLKIAQSPPRAK